MPANNGVIEFKTFSSGQTFSQKISAWGVGDRVTFDGANFTGDTIVYDGAHTVTVIDGLNNIVLTMDHVTPVLGTSFAFLGNNSITVVCFGVGTGIRTPDGDVAIETLQPGDQVVTLTANGTAVQAVKWVGHRRINLTTHPRPEQVAPIRIQRHAFAENVPVRDVIVSPDHAIFVDGKLISARQLVNHTTIAQVAGRTWYSVLPRQTRLPCNHPG